MTVTKANMLDEVRWVAMDYDAGCNSDEGCGEECSAGCDCDQDTRWD